MRLRMHRHGIHVRHTTTDDFFEVDSSAVAPRLVVNRCSWLTFVIAAWLALRPYPWRVGNSCAGGTVVIHARRCSTVITAGNNPLVSAFALTRARTLATLAPISRVL